MKILCVLFVVTGAPVLGEDPQEEVLELLRSMQKQTTLFDLDKDPVPARETEEFQVLRARKGHLSELHSIVKDLTIEEDLRVCALDVLGAIGDRRSVYLVLLILADDNDALAVRTKAVGVAEQLGDRRAILVLTKILRKKDRMESIEQDGQVLHRFNRWAELKRVAAEALIRWGPDERVIGVLVRYLEEETETVSTLRYAAYCLGRLGAREAIEPLLQLLSGKIPPDVRSEVYWALGRLKSEEALPSLMEGVDHPVESVAIASIQGLGHLGELAVSSVPTLIRHLRDPKKPLMSRSSVADALVRIAPGDVRVVRTLVEGLGMWVPEEDDLQRRRVIHVSTMVALQFVRHPKVIPALIRRLDSEDAEVVQASAILLHRLTGESLGKDATRWMRFWKKHSGSFSFDDKPPFRKSEDSSKQFGE